jgi:hypothetical protein
MWPERIRAAKGTTGAGLAIGMTKCVFPALFYLLSIYTPYFTP